MSTDIPDVIRTIVDQLGGARIFAMAFRGMVYDTSELTPDRPASAGVAGATFAIARALVPSVPGRGTHVVIRLMVDDTYAVTLHRAPTTSQSMRGQSGRDVSAIEGVHAGELRGAVESMTSLALTLGTLGANRAVAS